MSKTLMLLLFVFFCFIQINAQQNNADSLRQELATAKEDTNKVSLLVNLGGIYQYSYPDSGILYAQPALQLAQKLNFAPGEIDAYWLLHVAFSGKGNYPKALEASLKGLELCEKSGDSTKIIMAYAGIGAVYHYSNDYDRALYYFNKLKLNQAIFKHDQKFFSGMLGRTYFKLNQLDSALYYTQMCYDLDLRDEDHWPIPYFYLGEIYAQKKEYASAFDYYHTGINHSIVKLDSLDGYIGIAGVFKKNDLIDSAVYYARLAVGLIYDGSFPLKIVEACKILTDIYTIRHVSDSTLKYMKVMMVAKDSLFSQAKQNLYFNEQLHQQELQQKIEQEHLANKNRQIVIALLGGLIIILIIAIGLWGKNIYKQKSYAILQQQKQEIDIQKVKVEETLDELKTTQAQLIQSEKMASLGELTAGIAHEIQNPLNFVNNFSEVNTELLTELNEEMEKGNYDDAKAIAKDVIENEQKINHHGKRADAIVKWMLQHSQTSIGKKEPTDINKLTDEYLRLSYHGLRAKDNSFNATLKTDFDKSIGNINIIPQDIGRVLLNLFNNAFYAVAEKKKQSGNEYQPTVTVSTSRSPLSGRGVGGEVTIRVSDNGNGIPQKIADKIFQPFFTTKPTGQGIGLGLSLSYDIIKTHGGEIKVETKDGEGAQAGSKFTIILPA